MFKKILVIVIIIVAVIILIGLFRQIYAALGTDKRLEELLESVGSLERENKQFKKDLAQAESYDSVEEVARNDLSLAMPNETVIVVPENLIEKAMMPEEKPVEIAVPNWQGWLKLFALKR